MSEHFLLEVFGFPPLVQGCVHALGYISLQPAISFKQPQRDLQLPACPADLLAQTGADFQVPAMDIRCCRQLAHGALQVAHQVPQVFDDVMQTSYRWLGLGSSVRAGTHIGRGELVVPSMLSAAAVQPADDQRPQRCQRLL